MILVVFGLYLIDVAQLIFIDEVLFVRRTGGRWLAYLPNCGIELARRFLILPRLLEPGCALMRITWPTEISRASSTADDWREEVHRTLNVLRPLSWVSTLLLPQIFIVLPFAIIFADLDYVLVSTLVIIYIQVAVSCVLLVFRRDKIGISLGRAASLIFESLICVPYSINLYRKASLFALPDDVDLLDIDQALLSEDELEVFRQTLIGNVSDQIAWAEEGSARAEKLLAFRRRAEVGM